MSNFITEIKIGKVRHLENIDIVLGDNKKHLILTGKNGSGKTSILNEIDFLLNKYIDNTLPPMIKKYHELEEKEVRLFNENYNSTEYKTTNIEFIKVEDIILKLSNVYLYFNDELEVCQKIIDGKFILVYFKAQRQITPNHVTTTTRLKFNLLNDTTVQLNKQFIQYLVNLKTSQAFAQIRGNKNKVEVINQWFSHFENILKKLFDSEVLNLVFYDEIFEFKIEYEGKSFGLNELSDGYSSILAILTELILRMEVHHVNAYNVEGVVLIDEIETHLHVELQKNILPLLTSFFPNIQFIVTTHSPFVLQSIDNSIVFDLERKEQLSGDKLINASYTQIVKNYFQLDSEFSSILENEIKQYEILINKLDSNINEDEEKELLNLDLKLEKITPMLSDVIYLKFKQLQDRLRA